MLHSKITKLAAQTDLLVTTIVVVLVTVIVLYAKAVHVQQFATAMQVLSDKAILLISAIHAQGIPLTLTGTQFQTALSLLATAVQRARLVLVHRQALLLAQATSAVGAIVARSEATVVKAVDSEVDHAAVVIPEVAIKVVDLLEDIANI